MSRFIDITGQRFNKLVVLGYSHKDNRRKSYWRCRCDCGKETVTEGNGLKRGTTKSCGCYSRQKLGEFNKKDLTGKRFGRLVAIQECGRKNQNVLWLCQCDCGNITIAMCRDLMNGKVKSCTCKRSEHYKLAADKNRKHGLATTRVYNTWSNMIKRCYNPAVESFKYYGRRGIIVCDEWLTDFMNFYEWAMESGYSDELSIDRIDADGNYEPENCRWVTNKEQANNKRNSKWITAFGETHTAAEWQDITGISQLKINRRLASGYSPEQAMQKGDLRKIS